MEASGPTEDSKGRGEKVLRGRSLDERSGRPGPGEEPEGGCRSRRTHAEAGAQQRARNAGPFAEGRNNIFHIDELLSIAGKHGKSVAQVLLRWLTQRGIAAIPKSVRRERIAENFAVFDFQLSAQDRDAIAALDTGKSAFFDHRDPAAVERLGTAKRKT
ncbi:MAG TPA: aldo/keto reductase [Planctomycetota bacterium]|nr:aldo/keto reductase [Planctomycetota bacterium]